MGSIPVRVTMEKRGHHLGCPLFSIMSVSRTHSRKSLIFVIGFAYLAFARYIASSVGIPNTRATAYGSALTLRTLVNSRTFRTPSWVSSFFQYARRSNPLAEIFDFRDRVRNIASSSLGERPRRTRQIPVTLGHPSRCPAFCFMYLAHSRTTS